MNLLIIIFGALIFLAGIFLVVNPESIFGVLRSNIEKPLLHVLAVVIRLVIGAVLISQAGESRYPLAIEVIGWLSITAAVVFAVIGRERFQRLMRWALSLAKPLGRFGGVAAMLFGAFLVHSFT